MTNRICSIVLIMTIFLCAGTAPALAWNGSTAYGTVQDVHLNNTCWWAIELGFSQTEAQKIAKSCDGVDMGVRFLDKTWHLDRRLDTGGTIDTRLNHAQEEMALAKSAISKVPGLGVFAAARQRNEAYEHLGRGIHALQDVYAHMDAGVDQSGSSFGLSEHGMRGVYVDARDLDGAVKQMPVEKLYDDVLWDYTPEEGWHKHAAKEATTRWMKSRDATKDYLYQFLLYGYGPGR